MQQMQLYQHTIRTCGFQKIPLYSTTNYHHAVTEISWKHIVASESYDFLKDFCTQ